MKKLLLFLVVCLIMFSVGCEKDVITSEPDTSKDSLSDDEYEYEDDGIVEGDYGGSGASENLFIEDGRIFISKEPYFVLYLKSSGTVIEEIRPDLPPVRVAVDRNPTEVVLENNGHIEHLYTFLEEGLVGECRLVLIKEKSKIPPWEYKENVYGYCKLVHWETYETIQYMNYDTGVLLGDKFSLFLLDIPNTETADFFERCKTESKENILNYINDNKIKYKYH